MKQATTLGSSGRKQVALNSPSSAQGGSQMTSVDLREAAQDAIKRDWSIIPLAKDKKPMGKWKVRQTERLTLDALSPSLPKAAALGVVTGKLSGLIVLDTDDEQADQFMRDLNLEPHVRTPSGGHHYYFRHPGDQSYKTLNFNRDDPSALSYQQRYGLLDSRADGGYAAFAGTVEKGSYTPLRDPTELYELTQLPGELVDILKHGYAGKASKAEVRPRRGEAAQVGVERLLDAAGRKLPSGRDNACYWLACQLRDNGHSKEAALNAMEQFWTTLPMTNTKGQEEAFTLETALQKVHNAFDQPAREPWSLRGFAFTDLGNGERLAACGADSLKYDTNQGWLTWDGKRWRPDSKALAMTVAKRVVKDMVPEALGLLEAAGDVEDEEQRTNAEAHAKAALKHAYVSQGAARIRAMLELAETEPEIAARTEDFDQSPYLLNVSNGTLDLQTGELRPHRREDKLTRLVPVNYRPDAECPNWLRFIDRISGGDAELARYFKRMAGYILTGSSQEHAIFVLYGDGQNGKSTFVNALERITGEYAAAVDAKSLLHRRGTASSGINNDLARLKGVRLAHASEPDMGSMLDEALLKKLSSGERVTARFLHKEFFEFTPEFKLVLSANHIPEVRGNDKGIWRRLRLVPFTQTIPDAERQRDFFEKELEPELEGILAWAVEGALEWNQDGLAEPQAVLDSTQEYREEMDVIGQFVEERCVVDPQERIESGELYASYKFWCEMSGLHPMAAQRLGRELKTRGFGHGKSNGKRYRFGLNLKKSVGTL